MTDTLTWPACYQSDRCDAFVTAYAKRLARSYTNRAVDEHTVALARKMTLGLIAGTASMSSAARSAAKAVGAPTNRHGLLLFLQGSEIRPPDQRMWTKRTVTVPGRAGKPREVSAYVRGAFAVHRPDDDHYRTRAWQITHILSGLTACSSDTCQVTLTDAQRVVEALLPLADWQFEAGDYQALQRAVTDDVRKVLADARKNSIGAKEEAARAKRLAKKRRVRSG